MGTISRVMSLAPIISLDFSRSNARGRSDLHRPKDAWTSLAHTSPEYCKIGAAGTQRRRLFVRTRLFASQRPIHGGSGPADLLRPADRRDWPASCESMHRRSTSARRRACSAGRLTGRPRYSARRANVAFRGEFGGSRSARAGGMRVVQGEGYARVLGVPRQSLHHTPHVSSEKASDTGADACDQEVRRHRFHGRFYIWRFGLVWSIAIKLGARFVGPARRVRLLARTRVADCVPAAGAAQESTNAFRDGLLSHRYAMQPQHVCLGGDVRARRSRCTWRQRHDRQC